MKHIIVILLSAMSSFAATIQENIWANGETFLGFLEQNNISQSLYYNLPTEDKELATEIIAGSKYFLLKDEKSNEILQALIPIGEQNQIHIYKNEKDVSGFVFRTIPVRYFEKQQSVAVELNSSPYNEIMSITGDTRLANEFAIAFKRSFNISDIQRQDKIAMLYNRKYRLGKPYGSPEIVAAFVHSRGKPHYLFTYKDGSYYNEKGESLMQFFLTVPLKYSRISSPFSHARKHPILGYKRPHLGVDYAAPMGTAIWAAGDGVVSFVGNKGGYGKTVIISHAEGFKTLYGHVSRYAKGLKVGKRVKQGSLIAYVGSSGLSTGPHLHLGLYKNGQAINPTRNIKVKKKSLPQNELKEFNALVAHYKTQLQEVVAQGYPFYVAANEYKANPDEVIK